MTPEQHARAKEVFLAACGLPVQQRGTYLDQTCGDDADLRSHVEKLLEHHSREAETMPAAGSDETLEAGSGPDTVGKSSPAQDRILDSGTVIANRYRIVSLLGRGGMGEVYRAEDLVLGDAVALKFLRGDLSRDQRWLELFRREVQTARSVTHPNICRVHDIHINETSGETFISMAYIDGEDLRTLMRRIGQLPMLKAIEFARQLCVGLTAAHAHGILHRDLKPANIMIDGQGQVRITDFGLAATRAQIAENEIRAGTPAYMAPELFAGTDVSAKSDIYALGLVLFELFTGQAAFTSDSFEQIARAHQRLIPPSISNLAPEVPESIERVINACLEKNPNRRPATALTVAAALPGSDTLGLAQSAGITPSPTLVAASNRQRAERNWRQMAYLGVLPLLLAVFGFLAHKAELPIADEQTQPTAVQVVRSRELVKTLTQHPADLYEGYGWLSNASPFFTYPIGGLIEKGDPGWTIPGEELRFWYRCSPAPLIPETALNVTFGRARAMLRDPPRSRPGMTTIVLNDRGELRGFEQVPMPGENLPSMPSSNWSAFFNAAGLEPALLASTASTIIPNVHHDQRLAWLPSNNPAGTIKLRAAAASDSGLPVWFLVGGVNQPVTSEAPTVSTDMRRSASVTAVLLILAIAAIGAIPLAWMNINLRRSDLRGATRLAIFVGCVRLLGWVLISSHAPTFSSELSLFFFALLRVHFEAMIVWLFYTALEPYVRKFWPQTIVAWSRVLKGGFTDPLVGRDILLGTMIGAGIAVISATERFLPGLLGLEGREMLRIAYLLDPLLGARQGVAMLLHSSLAALYLALLTLILLVLFRMLTKHTWTAIAATTLVMATMYFPRLSNLYISWLPLLLVISVVTWSATRFGLVVVAVTILVTRLLFGLPLSFMPGTVGWDLAIFTYLVIMAMALFGFVVARSEYHQHRSESHDSSVYAHSR